MSESINESQELPVVEPEAEAEKPVLRLVLCRMDGRCLADVKLSSPTVATGDLKLLKATLLHVQEVIEARAEPRKGGES